MVDAVASSSSSVRSASAWVPPERGRAEEGAGALVAGAAEWVCGDHGWVLCT